MRKRGLDPATLAKACPPCGKTLFQVVALRRDLETWSEFVTVSLLNGWLRVYFKELNGYRDLNPKRLECLFGSESRSRIARFL